MTVKVNSEGDFAENVVSDADSPENAEVLSDLYDVLIKGDYDERDFSIVTLAHEVRNEFGDDTDSESDVSQWCDIGDRSESPSELRLIEKPSDMDSEPNIGRYFWKAISYTANDYSEFDGKYDSEAEILPLDDVNNEGEVLKNHLIEKEIVEAKETVHVPVNSEGELIPPFVVSEQRQEKSDIEHDLPTYEEGIERLETLLNDHFGTADEIETDSASNDSDSGSDSDTEDEISSPWENVHGIGSEMAKTLENNPNAHYAENGDFEPESRLYPEVSEPSEDDDPEDSRFSEENDKGVRIRTLSNDSQPDVSKGELLAKVQTKDLKESVEETAMEMLNSGELKETQEFLNSLE